MTAAKLVSGLVCRQAREHGTDGPWLTTNGLTHQETAREVAQRLGSSPVVIETRDVETPSTTFLHRVTRTVVWNVEPAVKRSEWEHSENLSEERNKTGGER
jgi:hypothetical protein